MSDKKKSHPAIKSRLHPRNKHRTRYDFKKLITSTPALAPFVALNKYNDESIDFSNAEAVKMLNSALLKEFYNIDYWDVPKGYLCPPIPGRADYIHHIAELLSTHAKRGIPSGSNIKALDIGVGANCVYPIIGTKEYGWSFVGSDVDPHSTDSAKSIVKKNNLAQRIDIRLQPNIKDFFYGVVGKEEQVDITICNPPFHTSAEDAQASTLRKVNNLTHKKNKNADRNFGGTHNELWCECGERKFILGMVRESKKFSNSIFMFSTLVSKQSNIKAIRMALEQAEAKQIKTIPMGQGNKSSRIVAWTFLKKEDQENWVSTRWK